MRLRMAHIGLCTWLLIGQQLVHAQEATSANQSHPVGSACASAPAHDELPSGREISIGDVTFSGFIQMPISDQEEIVASIKRTKYAYPLDGVIDEVLERVRAGWQNHGYFKVQVNGEAKTLTTSETSIKLALFVHVEESVQYRLGVITLKNNKALSNSEKLRDEFPIKDGDIFSREKIAKGLENLRKTYGEFGYINFTPVPNTTFDDEKGLAYLEIDVDEGKQFYVSRINVEGIGAPPRQQVLQELAIKPGDIWNSYLWEISLRNLASVFPDCVCRSDNPKHLDERTSSVALTLEFRPCSLR